MLEPIRFGMDEDSNSQFFLETDEQGNWFLTIPMPISGIGADVIHKLTETDKLECHYFGKDYITKQIKQMQASPKQFKIVSWR